MTGMKITLSAAMRARDVSRPYSDEAELPEGTDGGSAPRGDAVAGGGPSGGDRSRRRGKPRGAASASEPGDAAELAPDGGNRPARRGDPRGAASASERAQARFGQAREAPEAKREGSRAAQVEGTAPSPGGQGVRGIGVYPPGNKRTRRRKRRAD